eukprot:CAMPEP_0175129990 /NCGR_PEP_ID=MMETSP0087-20121206/5769_1 /TAXON_ID=136419 /ORGANISM="Unknown Unknown, Strain D1" /LENGTH=763 /DNA_ID=CAMNT_0016412181 /DNA_START=91 /DNA_END=2382 /DNA_ORIENTATION=-
MNLPQMSSSSGSMSKSPRLMFAQSKKGSAAGFVPNGTRKPRATGQAAPTASSRNLPGLNPMSTTPRFKPVHTPNTPSTNRSLGSLGPRGGGAGRNQHFFQKAPAPPPRPAPLALSPNMAASLGMKHAQQQQAPAQQGRTPASFTTSLGGGGKVTYTPVSAMSAQSTPTPITTERRALVAGAGEVVEINVLSPMPMTLVNKGVAKIDFDKEQRALQAKYSTEEQKLMEEVKQAESDAAALEAHSKALAEKKKKLREKEWELRKIKAKATVYERHTGSVTAAMNVAMAQLKADLTEQENVILQIEEWQDIPQEIYQETMQTQNGWGYLSYQAKLKLDIAQAQERYDAIKVQMASLEKAKAGSTDGGEILDNLAAVQAHHEELQQAVSDFTQEKKNRAKLLSSKKQELEQWKSQFRDKRTKEMSVFKQNQSRFQAKHSRSVRAAESELQKAMRMEAEREERAAAYKAELVLRRERRKSMMLVLPGSEGGVPSRRGSVAKPRSRRGSTAGPPSNTLSVADATTSRSRRGSVRRKSVSKQQQQQQQQQPAKPAKPAIPKLVIDPCNLVPTESCSYMGGNSCTLCGKLRPPTEPEASPEFDEEALLERLKRVKEEDDMVKGLKSAKQEIVKVISTVDHHVASSNSNTDSAMIPLEVDSAIFHHIIAGKEKELEKEKHTLSAVAGSSASVAASASQLGINVEQMLAPASASTSEAKPPAVAATDLPAQEPPVELTEEEKQEQQRLEKEAAERRRRRRNSAFSGQGYGSKF